MSEPVAAIDAVAADAKSDMSLAINA